jgi:hypothetical protein
VVGNLARLLGNSVGLGVAEALRRYRSRRELSGEAILLNVKTSMYLHIPNNVRPAELGVDGSDCTPDTFQRLAGLASCRCGGRLTLGSTVHFSPSGVALSPLPPFDTHL